MSSRRGLTTAVLLCAAGSGLVLLALGRAWITFRLPDQITIEHLVVRESGRRLLPSAAALAWVGLAAALLLVVLRGVARTALGVIVALLGVALVVVDLGWLVHRSTELRAADAAAGFHVAAGATHPLWPVLAAVGGLVVLASGVLTARSGARWGGLGSSYEAPGGAPPAPVTDKGVWDALDRGDDPTA